MPEDSNLIPPAPAPEKEKHSSIMTVVVLVLVLFVVGAISFIAQKYSLISDLLGGPDETTEILLAQLSDLATQGAYDRLIEEVEQFDMQAGNRTQQQQFRSIVGLGQFMTGLTNQRIAAVKGVKQEYSAAKTDWERSIQANRALEFLGVSKDREVFDEVFAGEPFAQFKVEGDFIASLRNLADHSHALNPNSTALWYTGLWHAAHITDIEGDRGATPEEQEFHAEALLDIIARAEGLYAREYAPAEDNPVFVTMMPARYWFWRGYFFGMVARVDEAFLSDAEFAYNRVFDYYNSQVDENGNHYTFLETMLPAVHQNYALDLFDVGGGGRLEDIQRHTAAIMELVATNPDQHEGSFIATQKGIAFGKLLTQSHAYDSARKLTTAYPPYKAFLSEYGVVF